MQALWNAPLYAGTGIVFSVTTTDALKLTCKLKLGSLITSSTAR